MNDLSHCYEKVISHLTWEPETLSVVQAVAVHREHWRPARVSTLLLAESHVYTAETDCISMGPAKAHPELEGVPEKLRAVAGAALQNKLQRLIPKERIHVLPQPQARLPAREHEMAFRRYHEVCTNGRNAGAQPSV